MGVIRAPPRPPTGDKERNVTDPACHVAIVDDDPVLRLALQSALEDHFSVTGHASGDDFLAALEKAAPDVILLDIAMPGQDGYEVCRRLRADFRHRGTPLIFISAHEDKASQLAAYEAGGDDFIIKPCAPEDVLRKVRLATRLAAERKALDRQVGEARQAAFAALSSMGELGVVLQFAHDAALCPAPEAVAQALIRALDQYSLGATVALRDDRGQVLQSSDGPPSPLASAAVDNLRTMGRLVEFRSRLAVNYDHVTLLVHNLPQADRDRCGRIRDNLAILAETAENRLCSLIDRRRLEAQSQGIRQAVQTLSHTLAHFEQSQLQALADSRSLIADGLRQLEEGLVGMNLNEAQEVFILGLLREWGQQMVQLLTPGDGVLAGLRQGIADLRPLLQELATAPGDSAGTGA